MSRWAEMRRQARAVEEKANAVQSFVTGDCASAEMRAEVAELADAVGDLASVLVRMLEAFGES